MYLTTTRLDIMYGESMISKFLDFLQDSQWKVGKRILKNIVGTTDYGIWYSTSKDNFLIGYTDSDFVGNIDDQKSTSRYAFHMGYMFNFMGFQ